MYSFSYTRDTSRRTILTDDERATATADVTVAGWRPREAATERGAH